MHFPSFLILLFIILPIMEMIAFSVIGSAIGLPATLLIILLTGMLGVFLTRRAGWLTGRRLRKALATGCDPTQEIMKGLILWLAGVALLLPGFVTDALGLLLLIPAMRKVAGKSLAKLLLRQKGARGFSETSTNTGVPASEVTASELIIDATAHEVKDADPENTLQ